VWRVFLIIYRPINSDDNDKTESLNGLVLSMALNVCVTF